MTASDLQQRREAIVNRHIEAENQKDIEATIATFAHPRYEVNGVTHDGADAVRELLHGLLDGFSDLHVEVGKLRHADDAIFGESVITATHSAEWQGIPPTGRRIEVTVAGIFEFDDDRLMCEKVFMDIATALTQLGVLPVGQS